MRIIIDTNIIISALLKDGLTRLILNSNDFIFFAPEYTIKEINTLIY